MRVEVLPPPTRSIFWYTAPFLVATLVILPFARPLDASGWVVMGAVELLAFCVLLGLYSPTRFWWCWRAVGAIVFIVYLAYLISMLMGEQWLGNGRHSSANALNALTGLVVFGYPGFMYAVFGRFAWRAKPEQVDELDDLDDFDDLSD